jgi:VanZ family protein
MCWTFLIMAICWLPIGMLTPGGGGEHPRAFPHLDKVVHAGVFTVFGVLWLLSIPGKSRFLVVLAAGAALAGATEYGQSLPIIGRDADVADGVADVVGVALAFPVFLVLLRRGCVERPVAAIATSS